MKKTIIYISGAGRSGSTLLDIVLGNHPDAFSLGELLFLGSNGIIDKEPCSCGKPVPECPLWKEVITAWELERKLSLTDYIEVQWNLHRNKKTLYAIWQFFFPNENTNEYIRDTKKLYEIIFRITNKIFLIDSSKVSHRILWLKRIGLPHKVIHLKRKFTGVLNSTKKEIKKNPEQGIERNIKPMSTIYSFSIWLIDNMFTTLFSYGSKRVQIKYEDYTQDLYSTINKVYSETTNSIVEKVKLKGPFIAEHLVAGNKLRMQQALYVAEKPMNRPENLSGFNLFFARLVDIIFY